MEIQSAKIIIDDKTLTIRTLNWGLINVVLVSICCMANAQQIETKDIPYETMHGVFSVLVPLFLLKFSLKYQKRGLVILYNMVSYFHIFACFVRIMIDIYSVNDICGDCLCSQNKTCFINVNTTVIEIEQTYCQDLLLEAIFFVVLNLFMIITTLQCLNGLNSIIKTKQLTTVVVKNLDVPDLEENEYIPPSFEEKNQIPLALPEDEVIETINEANEDQGFAVGISVESAHEN
jgi:hypothetical protein